ncbi:hypothetical protein ACO0QE_003692 [Hanseniaspora vineae]
MASLAPHDKPQFYLLIVLYFLQGIGCGLSYGSVPFLLKTLIKGSNFTQIGIFSMSTYPYSLKILWSPIVDSFYSTKRGRRRSWIIPTQYLIGVVFLILGSSGILVRLFPELDPNFSVTQAATDLAQNVGSQAGKIASAINLPKLTFVFGFLIFLCATQDIAVDGWALEILSEESLSFASTAQTVGLNCGYFTSFTVFLSFNSPDFTNKYLRKIPKPYGLISLPQYLTFCGVVYMIITTYVAFYTKEKMLAVERIQPLKQEDDIEMATPMVVNPVELPLIENSEFADERKLSEEKPQEFAIVQPKHTLTYVYRAFLKIIKLPNVQTLCAVHLVTKFAFQCNEGATQLKLLDKGFRREDLAITVLIDFPFEIIFGYYVGKLSSSNDLLNSSSSSRSSSSSSSFFHSRSGKKIHFLIKLLFGELGVLTPFLFGFLGRLLAAALGSCVVWMYPSDSVDGELPLWYFLLVIVHNLLGSFMNTIQFVSICAFHTRIADPMIGGTYMTLLNTISNLGGTWPKILVMKLIDYGTVVQPACIGCEETVIVQDGYYKTNFLCVTVGLLLYFGFIKRKMVYLQKTDKYSWRA